KRFISLKMKLTQENSKLETKCRKLVDIFPDGKSVDSKLSECVNFCFPNFSFGKQFEKKETTIKKAIQATFKGSHIRKSKYDEISNKILLMFTTCFETKEEFDEIDFKPIITKLLNGSFIWSNKLDSTFDNIKNMTKDLMYDFLSFKSKLMDDMYWLEDECIEDHGLNEKINDCSNEKNHNINDTIKNLLNGKI